MTPRREYALVLGLLVASAVTGLVASGGTWVELPAGGPLPGPAQAVTGAEVAPLVRAGSLVALAGALAVLATRRRGRVVVGLLVALAGVAIVTAALREVGASGTWWPLVAAAAGLAVAGSGLSVALRGRRWPAMGSRYEGGRRPGAAAGSAWDALDRGEDPTLDPDPDPDAASPPPGAP